jgi:Protein of unknown function (DUF2934)
MTPYPKRASGQEVTCDDIRLSRRDREASYTLWELEGRPTGREHWLHAEAELEATRHAETAKEAAPNAAASRDEARTAEPV